MAEIISYDDVDQQTLMYRKKLLALGLTPGEKFTLRSRAPLGDPIEVEIRGYRLSLRQVEAAILSIKAYDENCDCR